MKYNLKIGQRFYFKSSEHYRFIAEIIKEPQNSAPLFKVLIGYGSAEGYTDQNLFFTSPNLNSFWIELPNQNKIQNDF